MTEVSTPAPTPEAVAETPKKKAGTSTFSRVARYTLVRALMLAITVLIGLYLTILIANMGGYVDKIRHAQISEQVNMQLGLDPNVRKLSPEARSKLIAETIANQEKRLGMDQPFLLRTFNFLSDAVTLNLGRALQMTSSSGSSQVRLIILERLPTTLLLFGTTSLILFFVELFLSLALSRAYGSIFDKIVVALTPLSSAPGWFYGIFLILIFAALLKVMPFGGMVDLPPPTSPLEYGVSVLKHMLLPMAALTLSQIFINVFTWRTFFLIYSSEDYVDMAKAKGLPSRDINNKYILRPTLPTIITNFAFLLIGVWTGAPIFETVFNWPGLGRATVQAVNFFDTPVIVGTTVIYSYMLAITVFLLDIVYALVDPRVKIGGEGSKV